MTILQGVYDFPEIFKVSIKSFPNQTRLGNIITTSNKENLTNTMIFCQFINNLVMYFLNGLLCN